MKRVTVRLKIYKNCSFVFKTCFLSPLLPQIWKPSWQGKLRQHGCPIRHWYRQNYGRQSTFLEGIERDWRPGMERCPHEWWVRLSHQLLLLQRRSVHASRERPQHLRRVQGSSAKTISWLKWCKHLGAPGECGHEHTLNIKFILCSKSVQSMFNVCSKFKLCSNSVQTLFKFKEKVLCMFITRSFSVQPVLQMSKQCSW